MTRHLLENSREVSPYDPEFFDKLPTDLQERKKVLKEAIVTLQEYLGYCRQRLRDSQDLENYLHSLPSDVRLRGECLKYKIESML